MKYLKLSASDLGYPLREEFDSNDKVKFPPVEGLSESEMLQWYEDYVLELDRNAGSPRVGDDELFGEYDRVGLEMARKIAKSTGYKVKYYSSYLGGFLI